MDQTIEYMFVEKILKLEKIKGYYKLYSSKKFNFNIKIKY